MATLARQLDDQFSMDTIPEELEFNPHEPVLVIGEFTELSDSEAKIWAEVPVGGTLRLGVRFPGMSEDGFGSRSEISVIVPSERIDQLAPSVRQALLTRNGVWRHADEIWVPITLLQLLTFQSRDTALTKVLVGAPELPLWWWLSNGALPSLIALPGPEVPPPTPATLLEPILARKHSIIFQALQEEFEAPDLLAALARTTTAQLASLGEAFDRAVPLYVEGATGGKLDMPALHPRYLEFGLLHALASAAIGDPMLAITYPVAGAASDQGGVLSYGVNAELWGALGAGAKRATLMALLELYLDQQHWDPQRSLIISLEEPEVGLHPAAQRRVGEAISRLAGFGAQAVIVTHSPILMNAAPGDSVRLVKAGPLEWRAAGVAVRQRSISRSAYVAEVARAFGSTPADALLGERFLVVEGASDGAVLSIWARTLGTDLESSGTRVFPAGGSSRVENLAAFIQVAYEGAAFHVVLDSGKETKREAEEMKDRFGDRVDVSVLHRSEIEAYYSRSAVVEWLQSNGAQPPEPDALPEIRKRSLRDLARQHLSREYRTVADGVAIASLMSEAEIPADIVSIVSRLS